MDQTKQTEAERARIDALNGEGWDRWTEQSKQRLEGWDRGTKLAVRSGPNRPAVPTITARRSPSLAISGRPECDPFPS